MIFRTYRGLDTIICSIWKMILRFQLLYRFDGMNINSIVFLNQLCQLDSTASYVSFPLGQDDVKFSKNVIFKG